MAVTSTARAHPGAGRSRPRRALLRGAVVAVLAVLSLGLAGCGDPDGGGGGGGYVAAGPTPLPEAW